MTAPHFARVAPLRGGSRSQRAFCLLSFRVSFVRRALSDALCSVYLTRCLSMPPCRDLRSPIWLMTVKTLPN